MRIFPLGFLGSSSTKTTDLGTLNGARSARANARSSSGSTASRATTTAQTASIQRSSRDADDRDLGDRGMPVQDLLDLARGDVLAARVDHVLLAVDDRQVAVRVHGRQIPGVKPAAGERRLGALGVVVVAGGDLRRAVHDLADLTGGDVAQLLIDHARGDVEHGLARRAGLGQLLVGAEGGGERAELGLAVVVPQPQVRQALAEVVDRLDGHDRGAVVALGQRAQRAGVEPLVLQQADPDRRRGEERGGAMLRDRGEDRVRGGRGQDHVRRAQVEPGHDEAVHLRAVVERQRVQHHVGRGVLAGDDARDVLGQQALVGQHRALRGRLRAARVGDLGDVGRS